VNFRFLKFFDWSWYVSYHAKFSISSCNGWSIAIAGMKNFRALGSPLGAVSLTYRNLPLVVIILLSLVAPLHTPIIELTENFGPFGELLPMGVSWVKNFTISK